LDGKDIFITSKGRTTPALLEILCRKRYGFLPRFKACVSSIKEWPESWDAVLLIGDEALEWKHRLAGGPWKTVDLAREWKNLTGLPFVFAVWAVRRDFFENQPEATRAVYEALLSSKAWGSAHREEVLLLSEKKTELSPQGLDNYFSKLSYDFGENLKRAMRAFFDAAAECGLITPAGDFEEMPWTGKNVALKQTAGAGVEELLKKALENRRISVQEGVRLYHEASLHDLGAVANELNLRKNPESSKRATFVVDRNINYTNICNTLCKFCAFYRLPGDKKEGYLRTTEEIFNKIEELIALGGTQVLLQGGHNTELGIEYYEDIVRKIRARFPQVHVHSFSASEVWHISKVSNLSVREVLERLKKAGLNSLPGGGAEILVDRVRQIVSPLKTTVAQYFEVHRTAHELGLRSTATMVYGLGETVEERMLHFEAYRTLQDKTGGFRAFIPWTLSPHGTPRMSQFEPAGGAEYLKTLAISRLFLDNIQNIQSGWLTEGLKMGQVGLSFGANDIGGTLIEDKVLEPTGIEVKTRPEDLIRLIKEAGYTPAQRNTNYEILRTF